MTEEEWMASLDAVAMMCGVRISDVSYRKMVLFELAVCESMGLNELGSVVLDEVRHTTAWIEGRPSPFSREEADDLTDAVSELCTRLETEANATIRRARGSRRANAPIVRQVAALQRLQFLHIGSPWREWLPQYAQDASDESYEPFRLALLSGYRANLPLLRCIVGNPFRPIAFDPVWRTEHTIGLAARMYEDREFAAMPILADALEEAGCDNPDILAHCREPGPHARGCWVVDGVLDKR